MPPAVAAEVGQELNDREAESSLGIDARYACDVPIALSDGSYEITPLLGGRLKRTNSLSSSLHSHLNHGMLQVTSFLGLADDRELFLKKCDDADDKLGVFVRTYEREVGAPVLCSQLIIHVSTFLNLAADHTSSPPRLRRCKISIVRRRMKYRRDWRSSWRVLTHPD